LDGFGEGLAGFPVLVLFGVGDSEPQVWH
jgi:hypothetical protein